MLDGWLEGVKTGDGSDGLTAVKAKLQYRTPVSVEPLPVGWVSDAEHELMMTTIVARRVTHQAMARVAPMVDYAATNKAKRSVTPLGG